MIGEIVERDPGHTIVARQAYTAAYRSLSPWDHSEAFSFQLTVELVAADTWQWVGERIPFSDHTLRMTGGSMAAFCLEVAGMMLGDVEQQREARAFRDELVDHDAYTARLRASRE